MMKKMRQTCKSPKEVSGGIEDCLTSLWGCKFRRARKKSPSGFILIVLVLFFSSFNLHAEEIYLKPLEAIRQVFPVGEIIPEKKSIKPEDKARLAKEAGIKILKLDWPFQVIKQGKKIIGYALVDNELGKTEPITYLVTLNPKGEVLMVEILAYRESYGSEVKEKPFLKQFEKKSTYDPLKLDGDITNVTGATYSSKAITRGVKKILVLWEYFYNH